MDDLNNPEVVFHDISFDPSGKTAVTVEKDIRGFLVQQGNSGLYTADGAIHGIVAQNPIFLGSCQRKTIERAKARKPALETTENHAMGLTLWRWALQSELRHSILAEPCSGTPFQKEPPR